MDQEWCRDSRGYIDEVPDPAGYSGRWWQPIRRHCLKPWR